MANWYINPGLGSGTNAGTSWANAFNSTTLAWTAAITASSAGDDFYVNSASTVSNASAQTLTFKGTIASPNRVFSCSTITNNPPVSADLGAGAAHTTTGANGLTINGTVYFYGCNFNVGTGTSAANATLLSAAGEQFYDTCQFNMLVTTATNTATLGINTGSKITWNNTTLKLNGGTAGGVVLSGGVFIWKNTPTALNGTQTAIANLFQWTAARNTIVICDGVGFDGASGIASGKNIFAAASSTQIGQLVNCTSTTGAIYAATPTTVGPCFDTIVTSNSAVNYSHSRITYQGQLAADSTVYNNATDGTTPIGWFVAASANAKPQSPFECFDIVQWVAAGTYASSKIFATSATATLKTNDIWVDVEYLGANYPKASPATTLGAGSGTATLPQIPAGTTPGNLTSGASWAVGGAGNNYSLDIPSFTTSAAGYVRFKVKIGKASLLAWIDPAVTVA